MSDTMTLARPSSGPVITDPSVRQSCSLAGISMMRGKLVDLENLQRLIEQNIVEAEEAETKGDLINAALFALRIIKASCDATIGILADFTGPGGKVVDLAYGAADPFASNVGKLSAGQSVSGGDWAKAGNAALMAGLQKTTKNDSLGDFYSLTKIKNDIIIDAAAKDEKAIIEDLASYGVELTKMTVKYAGKETWGKVINIGKQLVGAGQKYVEAYKEMKNGDISSQMQGAKRMAKAQILRVQQQIGSLRQALTDCELEMAKVNTAQLFTPRNPADMVCR